MSELKNYELTLEASAFDGYQVFACRASSELEARLMLKTGQCEIIESNIEVVGLGKEPIEISESDDITSRLLQDVNSKLTAENKRLRELLKQVSKLRDCDMGEAADWLSYNTDDILEALSQDGE